MTPEALVRSVEGFRARDAVVLEDGAVAFDLAREDIRGGSRSKSAAARVAISGGEAVSRWLY